MSAPPTTAGPSPSQRRLLLILGILGMALITYTTVSSRWFFFYLLLGAEARQELRQVIIPFDRTARNDNPRIPANYMAVNGMGVIQKDLAEVAKYYASSPVVNNSKKRKVERMPLEEIKRSPVMTTQYGYGDLSAWSYDGEYVAYIYDQIVWIFKGKTLVKKIGKEELNNEPATDVAWLPKEQKLLIHNDWLREDDSPYEELFSFDLQTNRIDRVCEDQFYKYFTEVEHGDFPLFQLPCLHNPVVQAMFGSPENPTRRLIMFSPSGRFYFYFVFKEGTFIAYEWIEGYDTVRKRKWKVIDTHTFWDNFK